jgi:hypothetical protein
MLNPFSEVNWQPGVKERRKFATSLLVGFPCVAAVLLVAGRWHGAEWNFGPPLAVGGAGAALGLILWVVPQIARPFYVGWYAVAGCIGFLLGNVLLAAVYLLMFAPVGLAMRAMGRRPLRKGFDRSTPSYWCDTQTPGGPERYYRQY